MLEFDPQPYRLPPWSKAKLWFAPDAIFTMFLMFFCIWLKPYHLHGILDSVFDERWMGVPGLVILSTLTKSVIAHGIHKAVVFEYDNVIVYKNMNVKLLPVSIFTAPFNGSTTRFLPSFLPFRLFFSSNSLMIGYWITYFFYVTSQMYPVVNLTCLIFP